jgi:hypothetical protein
MAINTAAAATGTVCTGVTGGNPVFSATPSVTSITLSSGTALSSYVQGSWTPGMSFGGGTTGITYTGVAGSYTRIGNLVFASYYIILSNKGSSTGSARITGLPITTGAVTYTITSMGMWSSITLSANYTSVGVQPENAVTTALIQQSGNNVASAVLTDAAFANTTTFQGYLIYSV